MSNFPKNFPFGKGVWVWTLSKCLGGSVPAIIQKCKDNNISHVLFKCGDGEKAWDFQFNKDIVDSFHAAGLKIYSWSFVYGVNPEREAAIALWALDMGVDGHVFDAEDQWEKLVDPAAAATKLMQLVRAKYPDAFIAHSPEPIIDGHQRFPYVEFGKYCSAVMPQVYWNDWKKTPTEAINWVYDNFSRWEKIWKDSGFGDSIKPLIPVGSAYDNYVITPNYVLKPQDIVEFLVACRGYKSVNFWEFAHIIRPDCWNAIRDTQVVLPTALDLGLPQEQTETPAQTSTSVPPVTGSTTGQPEQQVQAIAADVNNTSVNSSPTPPDTTTTATPPASNTANASVNTPVGEIPLPAKNEKVTVTVKHDESAPNNVSVTVHTQKVALDYILDFIVWLLSKLSNKGGVKNE